MCFLKHGLANVTIFLNWAQKREHLELFGKLSNFEVVLHSQLKLLEVLNVPMAFPKKGMTPVSDVCRNHCQPTEKWQK
jgi:hypothetical protein